MYLVSSVKHCRLRKDTHRCHTRVASVCLGVDRPSVLLFALSLSLSVYFVLLPGRARAPVSDIDLFMIQSFVQRKTRRRTLSETQHFFLLNPSHTHALSFHDTTRGVHRMERARSVHGWLARDVDPFLCVKECTKTERHRSTCGQNTFSSNHGAPSDH